MNENQSQKRRSAIEGKELGSKMMMNENQS
jgi:hypothetical protein